MPHRLSQSLQRILEIEEPLRRFFYESRYAHRDPADPANCDFVAGNPQEMVLPEYVESLQRWTVPQDKDWYAYKFNEPYAQEAAAAGLRERRGVDFEADDILVTDGAFAGLNLCIRTVTDPGDEVIFLTPPWFFYEAIILGGAGAPGPGPGELRDVGPRPGCDRGGDHRAHLGDHRELAEQPERQDLPTRDPAGAGRRADRGLRTHRAPDLPDLGRGVLADRVRRPIVHEPDRVLRELVPGLHLRQAAAHARAAGRVHRPAARDARPPPDARGAAARPAHVRRARGARPTSCSARWATSKA